jgi:broad specificity phosphatase PhoE
MILARHGQTAANAQKLILGRADLPLTDLGRQQAAALARALAQPARVIASPLRRARETAEALAPEFGITPEEALEVPVAMVGSVEQICEGLIRRREEYGFSYWSVPADAYEAFAPVVARLAGT